MVEKNSYLPLYVMCMSLDSLLDLNALMAVARTNTGKLMWSTMAPSNRGPNWGTCWVKKKNKGMSCVSRIDRFRQ